MVIELRTPLLFTVILVMGPLALTQPQKQTAISGDISTNSRTEKTGPPNLVMFSSRMTDPGGRPIVGTVPAIFAVYAEESDEQPLWSETQIVTCDDGGKFEVLLGSGTTDGLPVGLFVNASASWLGFHAEAQPEQGRIRIASMPYALKAADADSLNGVSAADFVQWKDVRSAAAIHPAGASPVKPGIDAAASATGGFTSFIPKYLDASTFVQSSLFENAGKIGVNTTTPVAVLHVSGDGSAELLQVETSADGNAGISIVNSTQNWELSLRPDLQEALVIRNKTASSDALQISSQGDISVFGKFGVGTSAPTAQLEVAGDVKLSAGNAGIVFPDGSKQTTASHVEAAIVDSPNSVVQRDGSGSITANDANLQGNLRIPIGGYLATSDVIDQNLGVIPKVFLSASGGPFNGVIPSLTFRSLNPKHIFGEVAFQDNTASPGQDIWAMQQDLFFDHTENFGFRRRGQEVLTFWPLSANGSDILTLFSGSRLRLERSGPYPLELRDDSLPLPNGLWRTSLSGDCWLVDKNTALTGDFSTHIPMIQTCGDGNLVLAAGITINGPISAGGNFSVVSSKNVTFASTEGGNIRFTPGIGGFNYFGGPVGIGTTPQGSLHLLSGGNFQDGIFASFLDANEGISIRNTAQNWAIGIRADRKEELDIRNISSGIDVLEIATNGDITIGQGKLTSDQGLIVGKGVSGDGSGLKHGRVPIAAVPQGSTTAVGLAWKTPFIDGNYTVNCSVIGAGGTTAALRLHHIQSVQPDGILAIVVNDDLVNPQAGALNCMAMHD